MSDTRAREANAIALGNREQTLTTDLRKEFNALPEVKSYGVVQPVLQSAREAAKVDTPAADLNLVYAAAKIFDPGSVVREGEFNMVVAANSPAQRFMGLWNNVIGGGRLTKETRAQLLNEIESRARGQESSYKAARTTYEGLARKIGVPADQVFIEPSIAPAAAPPSAAPVQIRSDAEYNALPSGAEYTAPDGSRRRKR